MPPYFDHIEFSKPPLLIGSVNHLLFQKFKLIEIDKLNHLINILTGFLDMKAEQIEWLQKNANEISYDQTNHGGDVCIMFGLELWLGFALNFEFRNTPSII